jgi:hypothetical protein
MPTARVSASAPRVNGPHLAQILVHLAQGPLPWRAGQLAKAIHVLQAIEIAGEKAHCLGATLATDLGCISARRSPLMFKMACEPDGVYPPAYKLKLSH